MCKDWKKKAAKAFSRFLRNDNKTPLRSFPDPAKGGELTTDTRRVEELFRDTWQPIFNCAENIPPPSWERFAPKFHDHLTPLNAVNGGYFIAKELAAQAARFNNGAVGGVDGWLPAELRLLPHGAWEDRVLLEKVIIENGASPDVYYQVPILVLREGKGRTTKEHRRLFIFVSNYRLTSGVWCTRLKEPLRLFLHEGACGAIADNECIETAWDS